MTDILIKILAGTISTLGFCIIFRLKPSHWPFAVVDGFVACVCYFALSQVFDDHFLPNFLAAFFCGLLAEVFARVRKAPVTVFLLPGCIALVPGGTLYYTMNSMIFEDYSAASEYFLITVTVGIAIAGGLLASSLLRVFFSSLISFLKKRKV